MSVRGKVLGPRAVVHWAKAKGLISATFSIWCGLPWSPQLKTSHNAKHATCLKCKERRAAALPGLIAQAERAREART